MKIHYQKYSNYLITLLVVLLVLLIARIIGFGFALNLNIFFKIFFIQLVFLLVLESTKNLLEITRFVKSKEKKVREQLLENSQLNQKKIASISPFLPGKIGRILARWLSCFLLILYIFKIFFFNRFLLLAVFSCGIITELFSTETSLDFIVLLFIAFWLLIMQSFRLKGRVSLVIAIFLLFLCPLLLSAGNNLFAEKIAYWAYIFFFVGIIKMIFENRKEINISKID